MDTELKQKLEKLALQRSKPFCYGCYKLAPKGRCDSCGSDDLMRHVEGVGVEWGTEWIVEHIIASELKEIDVEESFEQSLYDCYGDTVKVGWLELDLVSVIKETSPTDYRLAMQEHEDHMVEDGQWIEIDGNFYESWEVENLVEDIDLDDEDEEKEQSA